MGNLIEVSGTTATTREGEVICPNDTYGQMQYILAEVKRAIEELGATLDNTIRTRVFLTNIDEWPAVAKAHGEYFASAMPASSFVGGVKLMLPDLRVEFEATLWVD
jgi:enamine deaminase RidA (YjgF/YER057c/UK114 family)